MREPEYSVRKRLKNLRYRGSMEKWNKDNPLRVFEAFAGYGSQSLALRRVKARINAQFGYSNGLNPDIEGFDFFKISVTICCDCSCWYYSF